MSKEPGHTTPPATSCRYATVLARTTSLIIALAPFAIRSKSQGLLLGATVTTATIIAATEVLAYRTRGRGITVAGEMALVVTAFAVAEATTRPGLAVVAATSIAWALQLNAFGALLGRHQHSQPLASILGTVAFATSSLVLLNQQRVVLPAAITAAGLAAAALWSRYRSSRIAEWETAVSARVSGVASTYWRHTRDRRLEWARALLEATRSRVHLTCQGFRKLRQGACEIWLNVVGRWTKVARFAWILFAFLALIIAARDTREIVFDDAAIIFRYAQRIVDGKGFTFNDGDRTNGSSAPLYTLVLTILRGFGADLHLSAKAIAALSYATAVGLAVRLAGKIGGESAAVVAGILMLASSEFRIQALNGLETGLAAALGLAALTSWLARREILTGIFLGLAVTNKLDAGILVVAIVGAAGLLERRACLRLLATTTVVALPWMVFAQTYFGSILPYSASQKLGVVENESTSHDPLWILRTYERTGDTLLLVLAGVGTILLSLRLVRLNRTSDVDTTTLRSLACAGQF